MAAKTDKKPRIFLSKQLGLEVPHGKVRTTLDDEALNYKQTVASEEPRKVLTDIRHKGGPEEPVAPAYPGRNASAKDKAAYKKARAEYEKAYEAFSEYKSDEFVALQLTADTILLMQKLHKVQTRPKAKPKDPAVIADLINVLNDKPAAARKSAKEFVPRGYKDRVGKANLKDPKSIQARIEELKGEDRRVQKFLDLSAISKSKYRLQTGSAVALSCVLQRIAEDISEHAIRAGAATGAKLIKNDAAIAGKYKELPTYPLWADLPHVKNLEARRDRLNLYKKVVKEKRRVALQRHNRLAKQAKADGAEEVKFRFEVISFNDQEARDGHATKSERINPKTDLPQKVKRRVPGGAPGQTVMVQSYAYSWLGIDHEQPEDPTVHSYMGAVGGICDTAAELVVAEGEVEDVRVGASLKRFISNIFVDLIYAMTPQLEIYLKVAKAKTVHPEMIKAAVTERLLAHQATPHGQFKLSPAHQELITYIEEKTKECENHVSTVNQQKANLKLDATDVKKAPKQEEAPAGDDEEDAEEAGDEDDAEEEAGDDLADEDDAAEAPAAKAPAPKVAAKAPAPKAPAPKAPVAKANGKAPAPKKP